MMHIAFIAGICAGIKCLHNGQMDHALICGLVVLGSLISILTADCKQLLK